MADKNAVTLSFPGGRQVEATIGGHTILTDQPIDVGGQNAGPSPYALFIASIGACAGFYALSFCQKRDLPTDGLRVTARPVSHDGTLAEMRIDVELPAGFPEKYRAALLRAIDGCSVKRAIQAQPAFHVELKEAALEEVA